MQFQAARDLGLVVVLPVDRQSEVEANLLAFIEHAVVGIEKGLGRAREAITGFLHRFGADTLLVEIGDGIGGWTGKGRCREQDR